MSHQKPTKEELEAGIKAAIEESAEEENPQKVEESSSVDEKIEEKKEEKIETKDNDSEESSSVDEKIEEKKEESSSVIDYKKKFTESSREAQVISSKLKKTNEAIENAAKIIDIPEEQLKQEFPEWDDMSSTERRLAKDAIISKKRFDLIHGASLEGKDQEAWYQKVDEFVGDPKILNAHPDLEGKQEDFKVFASKQTRRGADFTDLVGAFLFEVEKSRPSNKGKKMFDTGSGGPNVQIKPKSDKISIEESAELQQKDYSKYRELLMAGKISNDVE